MGSGFSVGNKRKRSEESASPPPNDDGVCRSPSKRRAVDSSSSSSLGGQPGCEYEVFLSFRGSDTRKGFTDILYTALVNAGVRVFRDSEELHVGEKIGPELLRAIKQSNISIPIFSQNYASSKWCLDELDFMMECRASERRHTVIPVFYDVPPHEVRDEDGKYARDLQVHSKKQDYATIQRWKKALSEVGSLKGLELKKEADGFLGRFTDMIVTKILKKLKKDHLSVTKDLVGIDDKVEAVMELLYLESQDVRFVGIWGMGGIGKTTLAKFIYNKISNDFDSCCFLQDIRETSMCSSDGIQKSQSQLIAGLLRCDQPSLATTDEGINLLRKRLREKKVLILLDDIDQPDHLKALAAEIYWFGRGSRIIITTRNKDVLKKVVEERHIYEVKELDANLSLQLFCKHALRVDSPTSEWRDLSREIVMLTGGLPLALEVIGSLLMGKNQQVWKSTSQMLKLVPNEKVEHKLKISYNALTTRQQQMFLDVACLFIGEYKRRVAYFWEDIYKFSPESNIDVLELHSLIKFKDDGKLHMHNQLRDLGREIVRQENYDEPGKRSRLWGQEALEVLENKQGSKCIKGIKLDYCDELQYCYFMPEQFKELSMLRFLQLECATLSGNFEGLLPQLRWLSWNGSECLATNLNLINLLILDLSCSNVTNNSNLWNEMITMKLKVLDLSNCKYLMKTPSFHAFHNLEMLNAQGSLDLIDPSIGKHKYFSFLNLRGGPPRFIGMLQELIMDGTGIKELPDLQGLKKLEILSARDCEHLINIPISICGLTSLSDLIFDGSKIRELPQSIGSLVTIRRLKLAGTLVKELPNSIGCLKSLVQLGLSKTKVGSLPDSMENLTNLEELLIDHSSVMCLPAALRPLRKLRCIDASKCRMLGEISVDLGCLSSLKVLLLRQTNLTFIPETIMGLSCLEILDLGWCTHLETLPPLPSSLVQMSVTCQRQIPASSLSNLINLKRLDFVGSVVSKEVFGLPKLEKLHISRSNASILMDGIGLFSMVKELIISNISLSHLFGFPPRLHSLIIFRCHSLVKLSCLSNLKLLSVLMIHSCPKLVEIEDLRDLPSLRRLYISCCAMLSKLDGLEILESLVDLNVESCVNLEVLPDLSKLTRLSRLEISHASIETLSGISCLKSLWKLSLRNCPQLHGLDGLNELERLQSLNIIYCGVRESFLNLSSRLECLSELPTLELKKVKGFEGVECIERKSGVTIEGCKAIERLQDLSKLKVLRYIFVEDCQNLEKLEGLDKLEKLEILVISGCKAIEKMQDLSKLKVLRIMYLQGCEKLEKLEGLDKLETLEDLIIQGCKAIEKLPDLSNLEMLCSLVVRNCKKLQELEGVDKLGKLKLLIISGCKSMKKLPDLSNLEMLRILVVKDFGKLKELKGIDKLGKLEELVICRCKSMKKLPDLSSMRFLRHFKIRGCQNLRQVGVVKDRLLKRWTPCPGKQRCQWIESDDIDKLQELDYHIRKHMTKGELFYSSRNRSKKLREKSNLGILMRWYDNGCNNIPQLEGFDGLEGHDIYVDPFRNYATIRPAFPGAMDILPFDSWHS